MDLRQFVKHTAPVTPSDSKRRFYFDCETWLITQEMRCPPLVCMQYAYDDAEPEIVGGTEDEKTRAKRIFFEALRDPNVEIIAHSGFFDLSVMLDLNDYKNGSSDETNALILEVVNACLAGRIRDTSVMGRLNAIEFDWMEFDRVMYTEPVFSLAYLTKRFTGAEIVGKSGPDVWRLRYRELDGLHPALWPLAAQEYAFMDVVHLRNVFKKLSANKYADEAFQTASAWALYLMGLWGIHTDPVRVQAWVDFVEPKMAAVVADMVAAGLMRYNSPVLNTAAYGEAIAAAARAAGKEPKLTATGKVASDAAYIRSLGVPMLLDKDKWREPQKPSKIEREIRERVRKWYTEAGLPVPMTEGTKNEDGSWKTPPDVSLTRDALASTRDPALLKLAEIGEIETLVNTFLPAFKRARVLHPHWNVLVSTGRVSVSAGKGAEASGVNLNNIPKLPGVRECFVARDGYVLWDGDYDQAELCALAQECLDKFGYSNLSRIIKEGLDVHSIFGVELVHLFGRGDLFTPGSTKEEQYHEFKRNGKRGWAYDWRQLAKAFNFGLPGGLGCDTFLEWARKTYGVTMPRELFAPAKRLWLSVIPEVQDLFDWVSERTKAAFNGKFTFVQHRSGRRRGGCNYTRGCNTGFQGLTADGAKNALLKIFIESHTRGSAVYGCRIVAQIYDEFLIEVPRAIIDTAHPRLRELMRLGMEEYTPDVLASASAEVMLHWSKTAKLAVVDGKIVPYDEITEALWSGLSRFLFPNNRREHETVGSSSAKVCGDPADTSDR